MLLTRQQLRAHVMASDDPLRYALTHLKIEPNGVVSATNGHVAVRVTPKHQMDEGEFPDIPGLRGAEPETDVMIPVDMAKAAERMISTVKDMPLLSMGRLLVSDRAMIGATDLETPHVVAEQRATQLAFDFKFPDLGAVIPKAKGGMTVVLRAAYLEVIGKYAKSFAGGGGVKLTIFDAETAVRFEWADEWHDVEGCVMPMRQ